MVSFVLATLLLPISLFQQNRTQVGKCVANMIPLRALVRGLTANMPLGICGIMPPTIQAAYEEGTPRWINANPWHAARASGETIMKRFPAC